MTVSVLWDDGKTEIWESGVKWDRTEHARSPFLIRDIDNRVVAEVPDFGVRYLQRSN